VTEAAVETTQLTVEQVHHLLGMSATVTLIEDAIQNLEAVPLEDEDLAALRLLDDDSRMRITARMLELAEVLREILRNLDGQLLVLTAEQ
jgi:hypothetical protein